MQLDVYLRGRVLELVHGASCATHDVLRVTSVCRARSEAPQDQRGM
jgi:hypothetical protein